MLFPDPQPVYDALQAMLMTGRTFWRPPLALDPLTGCDCYGVVWQAFFLAGIRLPEDSTIAATLFDIVSPPYQPFDLMLCRSLQPWEQRHVGIFLASRAGFHCGKNTNGLAHFSLDKGGWLRLMHHGLRYKAFSFMERLSPHVPHGQA
jgi:cell wall-associated NlpC family hydrolase